MRVLFTTTAGLGHFHPLVPVAQVLKARGHAVAFACPGSFRPVVEKVGFEAFAAGRNDDSDPQIQDTLGQFPNLSKAEFGTQFFLNVFVSANTRLVIPDLLRICQEWSPDLLVREDSEFGAVIAAQLLGLPHACIQISASLSRQFMQQMLPNRPDPLKAISEKLDLIRQSYGLAPDPHLEELYRHQVLSFMPTGYYDPKDEFPTTRVALRPQIFDQSGAETLPDWLRKLENQPTVYITLGSESNKIPGIFPEILQTMLAGLRNEPLNLIVTVGREQDPLALGPQPANVHIERYLPQSLVLEKCDLVVMHGGTNTTQAALNFGLPVVVVPLFADQPYNAERCAALKLGEVIEAEDLTPRTIQRAVRAVLANPQFRQNVARLRAELGASPGPEHGASLLESLVAHHSSERLVYPI
jgi:MGT family glycosyltransferase